MAGTRTRTEHRFGRARPSTSKGFRLHVKPARDTAYRELPSPTGSAPFRLDLRDIIHPTQYRAIVKAGRMAFHVNGDMGGINDATPQTLVARGMERDLTGALDADRPAFLYVLGDCVYFNGEVKQYYSQFYHPYEFYSAPIFAVPGNHDGENLAGGSPLDGFVRNFCAPEPITMPESGDSGRTAMVQPNVYWTLVTPLATIVGLYTNVPEGGDIRSPQAEWLVGELKKAPRDRVLLLAMHHPVYSADDHHSGSTYMKHVLERAALQAGRQPDLVLAGHVHNYQRLTRSLGQGRVTPYLVAGAGGYHGLHGIMTVHGEKMIAPVDFRDGEDQPVRLERYSDDRFGFLRLEVTTDRVIGRYYTVPRPQEPYSKARQLVDYFEYDWRRRKYAPNQLG
jgi:Icc-related predicted phosphoesterase